MIDPTDAQLETYFAADQSRPVMFINCHGYYDRARYPDNFDDPAHPRDVSGREAYHRYLKRIEEDYLPQVGGRFLITGPVDQVLIGEGSWHEVIIGQYPSRAEAMRMPTLPGYADLTVHRIAGLAEAHTLVLSPDRLFRSVIPAMLQERSGGAGPL